MIKTIDLDAKCKVAALNFTVKIISWHRHLLWAKILYKVCIKWVGPGALVANDEDWRCAHLSLCCQNVILSTSTFLQDWMKCGCWQLKLLTGFREVTRPWFEGAMLETLASDWSYLVKMAIKSRWIKSSYLFRFQSRLLLGLAYWYLRYSIYRYPENISGVPGG